MCNLKRSQCVCCGCSLVSKEYINVQIKVGKTMCDQDTNINYPEEITMKSRFEILSEKSKHFFDFFLLQ